MSLLNSLVHHSFGMLGEGADGWGHKFILVMWSTLTPAFYPTAMTKAQPTMCLWAEGSWLRAWTKLFWTCVWTRGAWSRFHHSWPTERMDMVTTCIMKSFKHFQLQKLFPPQLSCTSVWELNLAILLLQSSIHVMRYLRHMYVILDINGCQIHVYA